MAAPIGSGDWVECVSTHGNESPGTPSPLRLGAVYQVGATGRSWMGDWLELVGVEPVPGFTRGFAVFMFRPIYRPKADLIESLKAPPQRAPQKTPERVGASSREAS